MYKLPLSLKTPLTKEVAAHQSTTINYNHNTLIACFMLTLEVYSSSQEYGDVRTTIPPGTTMFGRRSRKSSGVGNRQIRFAHPNWPISLRRLQASPCSKVTLSRSCKKKQRFSFHVVPLYVTMQIIKD